MALAQNALGCVKEASVNLIVLAFDAFFVCINQYSICVRVMFFFLLQKCSPDYILQMHYISLRYKLLWAGYWNQI